MRPAGGFSGGCAPSALPGWQLGKDKGGMASYHCSVKVGGKGKAAHHASYIAREGKYSGYEQYEDLEATGRGNMPAWAEHNPAHFWEAADQFERANGATYREIEVALPRELTPDQRRELVEDFIGQELGDVQEKAEELVWREHGIGRTRGGWARAIRWGRLAGILPLGVHAQSAEPRWSFPGPAQERRPCTPADDPRRAGGPPVAFAFSIASNSGQRARYCDARIKWIASPGGSGSCCRRR